MLKKISSPLLIVLLLGLFLGSLSGCGTKVEEADAEAFLNRYFDYLDDQAFYELHAMYANSAFGIVSPAKALRGIKKTMKSFGPLESFNFDRGSTYTKENNASLISLKLSYDVVYENMRTREGFIVTKKKKGNWLIMSHTIERL